MCFFYFRRALSSRIAHPPCTIQPAICSRVVTLYCPKRVPHNHLTIVLPVDQNKCCRSKRQNWHLLAAAFLISIQYPQVDKARSYCQPRGSNPNVYARVPHLLVIFRYLLELDQREHDIVERTWQSTYEKRNKILKRPSVKGNPNGPDDPNKNKMVEKISVVQLEPQERQDVVMCTQRIIYAGFME